jgi:hypothetical protein
MQARARSLLICLAVVCYFRGSKQETDSKVLDTHTRARAHAHAHYVRVRVCVYHIMRILVQNRKPTT